MPSKKKTAKKPLIEFDVPIIHEVSGCITVKARDKAHAIELAHKAWEANGFDVEIIEGKCRETYWPADDDVDEVTEA